MAVSHHSRMPQYEPLAWIGQGWSNVHVQIRIEIRTFAQTMALARSIPTSCHTDAGVWKHVPPYLSFGPHSKGAFISAFDRDIQESHAPTTWDTYPSVVPKLDT